MDRKSYVLINQKYLEDNVKCIKENYPDYEYYFGVVKGNCYGHGFESVKSLIKGGCNYLAVATLEEALKVRDIDKDIPILLFGYTLDVNTVIKNNITLTITSYNHYKELCKIGKNVKVHIKINSGMNRLGLNSSTEVNEILNNKLFDVEGIYTHFATSGVKDIYWDKQLNKFREITKDIELNKIKIVHLAASLSIVKHPKIKEANGIRMGLVMYGYSSSTPNVSGLRKLKYNLDKFIKTKGEKISDVTLSNNLKLNKAMEIHSEVININTINEGEFVGYKASYIASKEEKIATVAVGHADGINRRFKYVLINNTKYEIVNYCMDYIMVKVDDKVKMHDDVVLLNKNTNINNLLNGSSVHELLVSITDRLPRIYK